MRVRVDDGKGVFKPFNIILTVEDENDAKYLLGLSNVRFLDLKENFESVSSCGIVCNNILNETGLATELFKLVKGKMIDQRLATK